MANQKDADALQRFREDPRFFAEQVLKFNMWSKQQEIAESTLKYRYTVVKSGNGNGKTAVAAAIGLHSLLCWPDSIVITTAPTARQVEGLLWKEINSMYRPELGGTMNHLKLSIRGEEWVMLGFTARESSDISQMAARMQGYHSRSGRVLIIFDEAAGVHPAFWKVKDSLMVSPGCRFLAIGNPTITSGPFKDAFESPSFNCITISCLDHPNVIEGREVIPGAVTREWVEERKLEWGENSAFYKAYVLGEFPDQGQDSVFNLEKVLQAFDRPIPNGNEYNTKFISDDVARFGDDRTVITKGQGDVILSQEPHQGKDTTFTLGRTKEIDNEFAADVIAIDDLGVGGGVTDGLNNYVRQSDKQSPQIVPINSAASPILDHGKIQFLNMRAEMYFEFAKAFAEDKIVLRCNKALANELVSVKYEYTSQGKIKIQSKEDMKKAGLKSPDLADSAVMGWWAKEHFYTRPQPRNQPAGSLLGEDHYLFRDAYDD